MHISERHLHIDVQSNQQQRGPFETTQTDQNFTPTMMRRSIGSHSAAKNERLSFLDKTAHANNQTGTFDAKGGLPLGMNTSKKLTVGKLAQN